MMKTLIAAGAVALTIGLLFKGTAAIAEVDPATPQPSGLTGSYVGVSVISTNQALDFGQQWFRQGNTPTGWFVDQAVQAVQLQQTVNQSARTQTADSKDFQGRLDLRNSPISIRGKVSVSSDVNVVQPIVSYDLAIAPNANLYAGAGYSFTSFNNGALPAGNHNSLIVVTGAEAAISKGLVIYGDAQYQMKTPTSENNPLKLQVGAGYRF